LKVEVKGESNMNRHVRRLLVIVGVSCILVVASTLAAAQKPAGPNRPAGVPNGYVVTPFGYFHPSCVRGVASGDTVLADGRLQHADGTVETEAATCGYPHYTARGENAASSSNPPAIRHSWIESGNSVNTTSSFGGLTATWIVPPAPTKDEGQTVYLFPGMEDYADVESIIQPVLGWNSDYSNAWGIASWNCCIQGVTWESSPVPVSSGDTIFGEVKITCKKGTKSCSSWNITTKDKTTQQITILAGTPSEGQTFTWAQAGALEVYGIVHCNDYPPNKSITFSNLALYDNDFNKYTNPGWVFFDYYTGLTPQCSYGGEMGTTTVTLQY
jgi:hypothetical protein